MDNLINYKEFPFGRDLSRVSKQFFGALTHLLDDLDIDRHFAVLMAIEKLNGKVTQQAIADRMGIDKVYMVKVTDYFIKKGYIKRIVNKEDRREYFLQLTAKGEKMMPVIHGAVDDLCGEMTKNITQGEMEKFYVLLNKLYKNLRELPSDKIIVRYRKAKSQVRHEK